MICAIEWNTLNLQEWEQHFSKISQSTLLQSYFYAQAACSVNYQRARWGLIKIDGMAAGLVQILEASVLGRLFHAVILDRGPLWFEGYGDDSHFEAFLETLNREFPARFGRRRRFIPEITDRPAVRALLERNGFKRRGAETYQTIWLGLTPNLETLHKNLKKKWRNALSKAQRRNLRVEWDFEGAHLTWFLQGYALDKAQKNYDGPSVKLMQALGRSFIAGKGLMIGRAMLDNRPVAAILIVCHGRSATYQIGWSSQEGRETAAHNLLLWEALAVLKGRGITDFDLGGINETQSEGIKIFKDGLGGRSVSLPGIYS